MGSSPSSGSMVDFEIYNTTYVEFLSIENFIVLAVFYILESVLLRVSFRSNRLWKAEYG